MAGAGTISFRKMFGEYGLYCDGRWSAFVCDDRLFLKTPRFRGAAALIAEPAMAPAYPGLEGLYPDRGANWTIPRRWRGWSARWRPTVPDKPPRRKKG